MSVGETETEREKEGMHRKEHATHTKLPYPHKTHTCTHKHTFTHTFYSPKAPGVHDGSDVEEDANGLVDVLKGSVVTAAKENAKDN